MLRILGSPKRFCDGLTRRDMLVAGGLGLFGLGLADLLRAEEARGAQPKGLRSGRSFGKAKACILLFLYGSPSQLETFDMKPDAAPEIRGEFKPIKSRLPGLDVCELLPNAAKVMDNVTVLRSLTHPYPIHGVAYATTGVPTIDVPMELNPHDGRHWPFIGSVVEHLTAGKRGAKAQAAPTNIGLPWAFSSQRVGEVARAGPYAAFLGGAYNPIWTTFKGKATRTWTKTLQDQKFEGGEPYMGITPESRFELATATDLPAEITLDRLDQRRSLVQQLDGARRQRDASSAGRQLDRYREMAYDLIGSEKVRTALDLGREPIQLRESYGMTVFGQAALAARRLVEAGSRFVTVFWDEYGLAGSGWDTHWDHYPRMRNELLPGFDMALYGLLKDLDGRGLLDETLVLVLSEHGRTPKIANVKGGGRDHWSQCYSSLIAGGGVARGQVIGRSDKIAGTVAERPISPKDVLATTYHLLGIDPETLLTDRTNRPVPLVQNASVIAEALA
jgi:Protein of unknown function (DUF1501)